jgi:hypothetical protein
MAHYLFNVRGADQEQAPGLLRAGMWGIGGEEKYRDALAPAELVLIYLAAPRQEFIGQAELASAVRDWTLAEAGACPGNSSGGVLLGRIEEWDPPVAMSTVRRPGERAHQSLTDSVLPGRPVVVMANPLGIGTTVGLRGVSLNPGNLTD